MLRTAVRLLLLTLALGTAEGAVADFSVGRLSALQGAINVQTPGDPEAHAAAVNEVVAEGDQLATATGSQAELQFGSIVVTLGPATVVALSRVESDAFAIYVARGSVALGRSAAEHPASVVMQGQRTVAYLESAGRYHLNVWPAQSFEEFSVRLGRASTEVELRSMNLLAGDVLRSGLDGSGTVDLSHVNDVDALDLDVANQLQQTRSAAGSGHLSEDWVGLAALDQQGSWNAGGDGEAIWVPASLPAGWAPYTFGHWVWNGVWGWTWVDNLHWAFLPYHYGCWVWWNNTWAWSPQSRKPRFSAAGTIPRGVQAQPIPSVPRLANARPLVVSGTAAGSATMARVPMNRMTTRPAPRVPMPAPQLPAAPAESAVAHSSNITPTIFIGTPESGAEAAVRGNPSGAGGNGMATQYSHAGRSNEALRPNAGYVPPAGSAPPPIGHSAAAAPALHAPPQAAPALPGSNVLSPAGRGGGHAEEVHPR